MSSTLVLNSRPPLAPSTSRRSRHGRHSRRRARRSRRSYALTPIHESQGGPCIDDMRGHGEYRPLSEEYKERYSCTSTYNRELNIEECIDRTILALDCLKARVENANIILRKPRYWKRYNKGWDSHLQPMRLLKDIVKKNHTHCVKKVEEKKLGERFADILGEINEQQHNIHIPNHHPYQQNSEAGGTIKTRKYSRKKRTKKRALKKKHQKTQKRSKKIKN